MNQFFVIFLVGFLILYYLYRILLLCEQNKDGVNNDMIQNIFPAVDKRLIATTLNKLLQVCNIL